MKRIITISLLVVSSTALAIGATLFLSPKTHPTTLDSSEHAVKPTATKSSTTPEVQLVAGGPPISWVPDHLTVTLSPGQTKQITVTATARSAISATAVVVVPALAPYVLVSPSRLTTMTAGSQQELTVTVTLPGGMAYQTVEGTLHLRSGTGGASRVREVNLDGEGSRAGAGTSLDPAQPANPQGSTIAKPLPITINVWPSLSDEAVVFDYPPTWKAQRIEPSADNDPLAVAFEALSPNESQFLVFLDGGYGYGLDDNLVETQTDVIVDGFQGIRRDFVYPNENVLTRIELSGVPTHPAFRIELRLEEAVDRDALEAILGTLRIRE